MALPCSTAETVRMVAVYPDIILEEVVCHTLAYSLLVQGGSGLEKG